MPLSTQPVSTEDENLTVEGKHLGELIPMCGVGCCSVFADRGVPGTIGCSYGGDLLCCDVSGEDFCRTRCMWKQSCCCLDFRAAVPTDKVSVPLIVNCCFVTVLFQRSLMLKFLSSVSELREQEERQRRKAEVTRDEEMRGEVEAPAPAAKAAVPVVRQAQEPPPPPPPLYIETGPKAEPQGHLPVPVSAPAEMKSDDE